MLGPPDATSFVCEKSWQPSSNVNQWMWVDFDTPIYHVDAIGIYQSGSPVDNAFVCGVMIKTTKDEPSRGLGYVCRDQQCGGGEPNFYCNDETSDPGKPFIPTTQWQQEGPPEDPYMRVEIWVASINQKAQLCIAW